MKAIVIAAILLGSSDLPSDTVRMQDGSVLIGLIQLKTLSVKTEYGQLQVPEKDISFIEFGVRPSIGADKFIAASISKLGSKSFQERENATFALENYGLLAVSRLSLVPDGDLEAKKRADIVLAKIKKRHPKINTDYDLIDTDGFVVKGKIEAEEFAFRGHSVGKITLARESIASIDRAAGSIKITVVADDSWQTTAVQVRRSDRITIEAEGSVDLYPSTPGQYLVTPKGYTQVGRGNTLPAGALLAKIGDGKPFLVGESYNFTAEDQGRLQLQVNSSAWQNASSGSYSVTIRRGGR